MPVILDKDQLDTHLLYFTIFYCSSLSTCPLDGHLPRVTIPDAASIHFTLLMTSI